MCPFMKTWMLRRLKATPAKPTRGGKWSYLRGLEEGAALTMGLLHWGIRFAELCWLHLYIFESVNEETQEADEETLRCQFPRFTQPWSTKTFSFFSAASLQTKCLLKTCARPGFKWEPKQKYRRMFLCSQNLVLSTGCLLDVGRICTCSVISQMKQSTATIRRATFPSWQMKICTFYQMHDGTQVCCLDLIHS